MARSHEAALRDERCPSCDATTARNRRKANCAILPDRWERQIERTLSRPEDIVVLAGPNGLPRCGHPSVLAVRTCERDPTA